jgi:hypothetical protein
MKKLFKSALSAWKGGRLNSWYREFKQGHPTLLDEEVEIICETRFEEKYLWMNEEQIQKLIRLRIHAMYAKKYPNAKKWTIPK